MNNNECNVARDLMPLVIDQVASEESRALVETHVAGCQPCAQVYTDMQAKTPEAGDTAEDNSFSAAMRQLRRTVGWRRIKVIVSSVVITLLLLAAGTWGYQFFVVESHREMPLDWYNTTITRAKDGTGLFTINYTKGYFNGYWLQADPDAGIIMLGTQCPFILPNTDDHMGKKSFTSHLSVRWKDGVGFIFGEGDSQDNAPDMVIEEIRMGTMKDYKILYQQGQDVPLCSDEMETILQLEKKHADAMAAASDALLELDAIEDSLTP